MGRDTPASHSHNQNALVPQASGGLTQRGQEPLEMETTDAVVPVVRVSRVQTTRVPAHQWMMAEIERTTDQPNGIPARNSVGCTSGRLPSQPGSNGSLMIQWLIGLGSLKLSNLV